MERDLAHVAMIYAVSGVARRTEFNQWPTAAEDQIWQ
jgi:hypothetical protein